MNTSMVEATDGHRPSADSLPPHRGNVVIQTHGCKLNQADSDTLARRFVEAGYQLVESVRDADVYLLNTCTVTATADSKARQALRAARRANPSAFIVAAGCYPQRASQELNELEAVSLVVGNQEKEELVSKVIASQHRGQREIRQLSGGPAASSSPRSLASYTNPRRGRSMLKIQEGCNQVCAYCIVPKVRGRERSIPPDVLVQRVAQRVSEGFQEVVLTGTQLGTYGFDIPGASLTGLLQRILAETQVARLRVSSLQPQEITAALLELWQDNRLCPHFHVPLQSGSDRILQAMRRRYDTAQFARSVELIRRKIPNVGLTTDLIVGFPGEGESEFQESRAFSQRLGFSDMHVFPYSPRPGTSATYLQDQLEAAVKKARVAAMLEVAQRGFAAFRHQQLGHTRPVLWESVRKGDGPWVWSGLTDNYIRVYTNRRQDLQNVIGPARLTEVDGDRVFAQSVSKKPVSPPC